MVKVLLTLSNNSFRTCIHSSALPSRASFFIYSSLVFFKIQSVFPQKTALISEKLSLIYKHFTCEYRFLIKRGGSYNLQLLPFYRHLVYLLLLRRKRKLRFLISHFKHSTGLFELALPYSTNVTYCRKYDFQPSTVRWTIEAACISLPSTKSKPKDFSFI